MMTNEFMTIINCSVPLDNAPENVQCMFGCRSHKSEVRYNILLFSV